jgi:hypothetical protein
LRDGQISEELELTPNREQFDLACSGAVLQHPA